MSTKKKYSKSKFLKEAKEAYKSILIAEGFLDVLVDLVFGRQIATAGKALANDPEYIKNLKILKGYEQSMLKLRNRYERIQKEQLDYYYITYGIDLYNLDRDEQLKEMQYIDRKLGKYKTLISLDKKQQDLNRKLISKKR
jgi:hypothetical protein